MAIGTLFDQLAQGTLQGFQLGRRETNEPEFLLTPRAANALVDRITSTIRLAQKTPERNGPHRFAAGGKQSAKILGRNQAKSNRLSLGKKPDRARLDAKAAPAFLQRVRPKGVIVEGLATNTLGRIRAMCENVALIAALPQVFFEDEIPADQKTC